MSERTSPPLPPYLFGKDVIFVMHIAMFAQIGGYFSYFGVELYIVLLSLSEDNGVFQMEMNEIDHFVVARLIEGVRNVRIEYIDLISSNRCVAKAVGMRFERTIDLLIG